MLDLVKNVQVNDHYSWLLDRSSYMFSRAVQNAVFMLDRHLCDKDASYLDSDVYKKFACKVQDTYAEHCLTQAGIIGSMLHDISPRHYMFNADHSVFRYQV